jgi:uncharacterized protein
VVCLGKDRCFHCVLDTLWLCGGVVTESIQSLLTLQERHTSVLQLKLEIERLPTEVNKIREKIAEEQAAVEAVKQEIRELELRRKQLELDSETADEVIRKYKNQQLLVKKNEEYRALTHEIELNEAKINDFETRILEIMEELDVANLRLAQVKAETDKRVQYQEHLIGELDAKARALSARVGDAEAARLKQVESMNPDLVAQFEALVKQIRRPPYIAQLNAQSCGGCHMRVSNDVFKQARMGQAVQCDQCGRLLFV